jgi:hypothetical protein
MIDEMRDPELRSLRDAWHAPSPRPEMHERILRECERELRRPGLRWRLAAAAGLVLLGAFGASQIALKHSSTIPLTRATLNPVAPEPQGRETSHPSVQAVARKTVKRAVRKPKQAVARFFPLMDVPPPLGSGVLIRVIVPASTLLITGLPVGDGQVSGNVEADLLIGEDGIARAIRFPDFE